MYSFSSFLFPFPPFVVLKKNPLYNTSIIICVINLLLVLMVVVLFPYEKKKLIDIIRFVIFMSLVSLLLT